MAHKQQTDPEESIQDTQGDGLEEYLQEIAQLKAQVEEAEGKWKRSLADYQNLERQTTEAQKRFAKIATQDFVQEMVGPYEHLKMAASHIKDKGLDMVLNQFRQVFETQGLKEINPLGKKFDPSTMEAIETKEGKDGEVLHVMNCGYELNGIVIQPARVVVGKHIL